MAAIAGAPKHRSDAGLEREEKHRRVSPSRSPVGEVEVLQGGFEAGSPFPEELFCAIEGVPVDKESTVRLIRAYLEVASRHIRGAVSASQRAQVHAQKLIEWGCRNAERVEGDADYFDLLRIVAIGRRALKEKKEELFSSKSPDTVPLYTGQWIPAACQKTTHKIFQVLEGWRRYTDKVRLREAPFKPLNVVLHHILDKQKEELLKGDDWIATSIEDDRGVLQGISFSFIEDLMKRLHLDAIGTGHWNHPQYVAAESGPEIDGVSKETHWVVKGAGSANIEELMATSLHARLPLVVDGVLEKAKDFYHRMGFRAVDRHTIFYRIEEREVFAFLASDYAGRALPAIQPDLASASSRE